MILKQGEKVFIANRPLYPLDIRRHFVGEVEECNGSIVRVKGYTFVMSPMNVFERKLDERIRIFSLIDEGTVVSVVSPQTILAQVEYKTIDGKLYLSDGAGFLYDVDEFKKG